MFVCLVAGFVVAMVYTRGWQYDAKFIRNNPHPVIGLVTIILALVQPIMALMRPHPGTKNRPIFNWAHWAVGNSAFILGVTAIFLAGNLAAISIPKTGYVICLVLYVALYVAAHLILTVHGIMVQRKEVQSEVHPMSEKGNPEPVTTSSSSDAPGSRLRKTVLGLFVLVNEILVIVILVLIFLPM